mgnify:CR=1 FL=1
MNRNTAEAIAKYAIEWGMATEHMLLPDPTFARARTWYQRVQEEGAFAVSILVEKPEGVMCICSNADSCRQDTLNMRIDGDRQPVLLPGWLQFDIFWYRGLVLDNIHGMYEQPPPVFKGRLGEVFDQLCDMARIPDWRRKYGPIPGMPIYAPLWNLLHDLRMPLWKVYTSGLSWRAFAGLDVYVRTYIHGMPEPEQEAWYVVLDSPDWWLRDERKYPFDWYTCRHWVSMGQCDKLQNWVLHNAWQVTPRPRM